MNAPDSIDRDRAITLGAYRLIRLPDGSIWIAHESGEGGAFPVAAVETAIGNLWRALF